MLFLATTKMRQIKMAEPSMLTAHTSGSARSVFWRHRRVVAAPMTTPNRPVTQVIAPKIRLERGAETRGNNCYFKYTVYHQVLSPCKHVNEFSGKICTFKK